VCSFDALQACEGEAHFEKKDKAVARWNRLGISNIQLKREVEPNNQTLAVGLDPGSRFEDFVVGTRDTAEHYA